MILLSRSGLQGDTAMTLVKELEAQGAIVKCPVCDVADFSALQSVLTQFSTSMPPIKGCIQASMVLRVCRLSFIHHQYAYRELGFVIREHVVRRLESGDRPKSSRILEPTQNTTIRTGFLHPFIIRLRHLRADRTIQLRCRKYLSRRPCSIPRQAR